MSEARSCVKDNAHHQALLTVAKRGKPRPVGQSFQGLSFISHMTLPGNSSPPLLSSTPTTSTTGSTTAGERS